MANIVHISPSKYRSLLSEVLPYERPIFFSNRSFVRFLKHYGVRTEGGRLVATKNQKKGLNEFLRILGGEKEDNRLSYEYDIYRGEPKQDESEEERRLSIIHPYYQVKMAEFYEEYRMLLIEYCNRSRASLRHPVRVAERQKQMQGLERLAFDKYDADGIDNGQKHYFAYENCDNINKFYEDDLFYQAEKQFSKMLKTDLKSCFESIQPNDLTKAVVGRDIRQSNGSFAKEFALLQRQFHSNNLGIVIGPEFSRIYAEMILQHIEVEAEKEMRAKGYRRNVDYVFYRYVDDGFLFFNKNEVREEWEIIYTNVLKQFGLKLNSKKRHIYEQRPFVDKIAIVKREISKLVDEMFANRMETFIGFVNLQKGKYDTPTSISGSQFIKHYRLIVASGEGEVQYKDITIYTLGIIRNRLDELLKSFNTVYKEYRLAQFKKIVDEKGREIMERYEREFSDFIQNIISILFFILACDTRMVTSMRVVELVHMLQLYVRGLYKLERGIYSIKFPSPIIRALDETISKETRELLHANITKSHTTMEMLCLLDLQPIMSPIVRISEETIGQYIGESNDSNMNLDFFTIFELMHFISGCGDGEYEGLKQLVNSIILEKICGQDKGSTESVLISIEALCNPNTDEVMRGEILRRLDVKEEKIDSTLDFIQEQEDMFITWRNYKIDHEVAQFENNNVY